MIESTFRDLLMAVPVVSEQVGSRVYPIELPDKSEYPSLVYRFISSTPSPTFEGHGTERNRVAVNCWCDIYDDATAMRYAVVQALDGYSADGLTIRVISKQDFFDQYARKYRAMVEFYVFGSI